jgi:hypothetical protein
MGLVGTRGCNIDLGFRISRGAVREMRPAFDSVGGLKLETSGGAAWVKERKGWDGLCAV